MLIRHFNRELVTPKDIEPSHPDLEVIGVFNPGAIRFHNEIILLVRVAEAAKEKRAGFWSSPKIVSTHGAPPEYRIDWTVRDSHQHDPRKYETAQGLTRLTSISHLELVRLSADSKTVIAIQQLPALFGHGASEDYGIEDARITQVGNQFFITYTAVSSTTGITPAMMSTRDFISFDRHGAMLPTENKDAVILSERINGRYTLFHRPGSFTATSPLSVWLSQSPDLLHWGQHRPLAIPAIDDVASFRRIGVGPPPIKTEHGWLTIYHEVIDASASIIGTYKVGAILTDLHHPDRPIAQTKHWIMEPSEPYEKEGFVPNVVFPTGLLRGEHDADELLIFYGAADTSTASLKLSLSELLAELQSI